VRLFVSGDGSGVIYGVGVVELVLMISSYFMVQDAPEYCGFDIKNEYRLGDPRAEFRANPEQKKNRIQSLVAGFTSLPYNIKPVVDNVEVLCLAFNGILFISAYQFGLNYVIRYQIVEFKKSA
jgi:hypothetical protein